ncbi:MAG: putative phosphoribosyl transferase [Syntrophaceae bacterium PtaU1.Bin231]|nr:MAG: putative phosphoribosyl transferase [Syntrophaceae bacterium PtaU1.Bin231]
MSYTIPPFRDRRDAGRILAEHLEGRRAGAAVVFAVPRGGVPVAAAVAKALKLPLDIIVSRKIPIPFDPEAGYGAVTEDGAVVLNEPLVRRLRLTRDQIERHAESVLGASPVEGRTAIVIDDGLASGYTMKAAVHSLRRRGAAPVIAAAPVASLSAAESLRSVADEVVAAVLWPHSPFAVASFYEHWHDLTDEEVLDELEAYANDSGGRADD